MSVRSIRPTVTIPGMSNPDTIVAGMTVPARFALQAARSTSAEAVVCGATRITYAQLEERSNRLAHHLIQAGAGPDMVVAVMMEPSDALIVALLAVLKAGAAYLPLEARDPPARVNTIIEDAKPVALIGGAALLARLDTEAPALALDLAETNVMLASYPVHAPSDADRRAPLRADHAAYVIYTSGTTGAPKGVVVTHHNVVRLFDATDAWYSFGPSDTWTLFHSVSFDFSVWEIWGALLYGGRLVVVARDVARSPHDFLRLLVDEQVTVLNQTPSAFYGLIRADQEARVLGDRLALRVIVFGGEALEFRRLEAWYRRHADHAPRLVNMYGITETTVHVSYLPLTRELAASAGASLIGRAIPDMGIHILDDDMVPVLPGMTGEIFVSGAGVARGYLNRPELTEQRFLPCPFGMPEERMYRSGDLAKLHADGALEYLGRADQQVKIRGHRIETGEVAAAIVALDTVADAAVIALQDDHDVAELVAYVVLYPGAAADFTEMRRNLAGALPTHMIPAKFMAIPALPLTRNGKLDRAALPAPVTIRPSGATPMIGQASAIERRLAAVWQSVLEVEQVGRDDNFFDLGGNSLLMLRMHEAVRNAMGVDIPVIELFRAPKISDMAALLGVHANTNGAAPTAAARPPHPEPRDAARARAQKTSAALRALRDRRDGATS